MFVRGTVKAIIDGDTFEVYTPIKGHHKVRLANVNAPEIDALGGATAMRRLRNMIWGRIVTIRPVGISYDRIVAEVFVNGISINERMRQWGYS